MNKDSFRILAQYNIWATQRLCESLKAVSDDDFNKDVGLYFKSIVGTLNHLLLGEHYLWYSRFKQGIALREHVLADRTNRLTGDHPRTNRRLNRHLKLLPRNQFA